MRLRYSCDSISMAKGSASSTPSDDCHERFGARLALPSVGSSWNGCGVCEKSPDAALIVTFGVSA